MQEGNVLQLKQKKSLKVDRIPKKKNSLRYNLDTDLFMLQFKLGFIQ